MAKPGGKSEGREARITRPNVPLALQQGERD